jgi:hypothetical protein
VRFKHKFECAEKKLTKILIINFHLNFLIGTEIFRPKREMEKHEENNVYLHGCTVH